jgi:hypothetical protein
MKKAEDEQNDDVPEEHDFTGAVRGKYAARYAAGFTVTVKRSPSVRFKRAVAAVRAQAARDEGRGVMKPAA